MMREKAALTDRDDGFAEVKEPLDRHRSQRKGGSRGFIGLMAILTLIFASLGIWQVQRLGEKLTLIAAVENRLNLPPTALPSVREWQSLDPRTYDFQPVELTGHFAPGNRILVFTALSDPRGTYGGPGYWVVEPFALAGGGAVLVNRGFVPETSADLFRPGASEAASGEITITGVARRPEETNAFTPPPDTARRIDYVRSVERLSGTMDRSLAPFAPIYVDQAAGAVGALPQGGETVTAFPNRHLEYALTWFALALLTPVLTVIWLRRQGR